jgi:hypothetical protein
MHSKHIYIHTYTYYGMYVRVARVCMSKRQTIYAYAIVHTLKRHKQTQGSATYGMRHTQHHAQHLTATPLSGAVCCKRDLSHVQAWLLQLRCRVTPPLCRLHHTVWDAALSRALAAQDRSYPTCTRRLRHKWLLSERTCIHQASQHQDEPVFIN